MPRHALLIALFTLPLTAHAETAKSWTAEVDVEASFERVRSEAGRAGAYTFTFAPSMELSPEWSLSAEAEAELETGPGEPRRDMWRDTTIGVTRSVEAALPFSWSALVLLPTDREEQESGLHAAPGLGIATELPLASGITAGYEAKGHRLFRNAEKAGDADRWRFEHELSASLRLGSSFTLEIAALDEHKWLRAGGREESLELTQELRFETRNYRIGIGHKSCTPVRNADGSRAVFALLQDSQVFGTVGFTL